MLFSTYCEIYKWERSKGFFGEPLKHVITLRGANLGKQNWRWPPLLPPRVSVQNVSVYAGTTRTCVSTCGRGACTHGDVLNVRTGTFFQSVTPHTTPHRTHHKHKTRDKTRRQSQRETDRDRERRQGKRKEKTEEERQKRRSETRDKTREEETRWREKRKLRDQEKTRRKRREDER